MPSASKTTTLYSNSGNAYYLTASFTETGTNTANNTSDISCTATLSPSNAYWGTSYSSTLAIYWHDNRQNTDVYLNSISFSGINSGETKSVTGTTTVYHRDDGALSGYAYAVFTKGSTTSAYAPNSGSVATDWTGLTNIDRYPLITSAPNFSDEDNPTITYTTNVGFASYVTEICIKLIETGDPIIDYRQVNVANGSYTFEFTEAERNILRNATPNSNTITVYILLRTMSSGIKYFSTVTRTLSIVNADPEISSLTVTETNQDVIDVLGSATSNSIIPGVSSLHAVVVPIANKGASISRVTLVRGGNVTSDTTSPYEFDFSPGASQTIIVTDSRGNSTGATINKTVLPYIPVSFVNFTFERDNPTSSDIILNLEANYIQQTYNQTPNVPIVKWKLDDGAFNTIPSTEYTIDTTNNKLTISNYELTNTLVYTSKGNFTISIEDLFTSAVDTQYVLKGIPTFDYGEHDLKVNGDLFVADINGENAYKVYDNFSYSTTETVIGTWIDGKPIYRKVLEFNNVPTGVTQRNHGISNFDKLINYSGYYYNSTWGYIPIPAVTSDNITGYGIGVADFKSTTFWFNIGNLRSSTNEIKLIVEYTKTTD